MNLPPELILNIGDFLPRDCILALKIAYRRFNEILPMRPLPKHEKPTDCERLLILSYLSRDPSRRRCRLCKVIYDISCFDSLSSPAEVPVSLVQNAQRADFVVYPKGLCQREVGRLLKIIFTGPGGRSGWTSQKDIWCMHCGSLQGWDKCNCNCDSCSCRPTRTYTQYIDRDKPKGYLGSVGRST